MEFSTRISSVAQRIHEKAQNPQSDAQQTLQNCTYKLEDAQNCYKIAANMRSGSIPLNTPVDENGLSYNYIANPDGMTDTISEIYDGWEWKTMKAEYNNSWDSTPNSILMEYYNPYSEFIYDDKGNCTGIKNYLDDKLKNSYTFEYDSSDRVIKHTVDGDYFNDADGKIDSEYTYQYCCENGDLISSTYKSYYGDYVSGTEFQYNEFGNVKTETDLFNKDDVTKYTYDALNRVIGMETINSFSDEAFTFYYDNNGNLFQTFYDNRLNDNKFTNFFKELMGKEINPDVIMKHYHTTGFGTGFEFLE